MTKTDEASEGADLTSLLRRWRQGDEQALPRLTQLVYDTLHALAQRSMRGERPGHLLQTTAVVHEAYLRLADSSVSWEDRAHFFAVAAGIMRRILVDHARAARRSKRGGGAVHVPADDVQLAGSDADLVELDRALKKLTERDPSSAQTLELHFFGGLTHDEIAELTSTSASSVYRTLRFAKAWLTRELQGEEHG